jgi:hypothetical protein
MLAVEMLLEAELMVWVAAVAAQLDLTQVALQEILEQVALV